MLVHIPVHTAKGLPVTVEVVCLVDVGVGLAEVAEAGPEFQFRSNHVAWVKFDEHLWHLCHNIARSVDLSLISIAEHHRCLIFLICRLLICEESVQLKSLERTHHGICCPSPCLYVVCQRCCHNLLTVLQVERRVVVGLRDIRYERSEAQPIVVVVDTGTTERNTDFVGVR